MFVTVSKEECGALLGIFYMRMHMNIYRTNGQFRDCDTCNPAHHMFSPSEEEKKKVGFKDTNKRI